MNFVAKSSGKALTALALSAGFLFAQPLLSITAVSAATGLVESSTLVGKKAPDFSLSDTDGKPIKLSEYKGKTVVLEWFNFECPFVKKHYDSGNMQKLQKEFTAKGVVWLSICSSAKGKPGNASAKEQSATFKEKGGAPTAILLDEDGTIGHLYGARTTPDMYVVDKSGTLVYAGAIDSKSTPEVADVAGAQNYVKAALDEVLAGKPVNLASTKSYGCSVKYAPDTTASNN